MSLVQMPVPSQGGHPLLLPLDYDDLDIEGQRLARVNASRQWIIGRPPAQKAEAAIACYNFFQAYYLRDDHEDHFTSGFFDDEPLPTPQFHHDIVASNAVHDLSVVGAPRGSAKSTVGEILRFMKVLTRPLYSVGVTTASQRLVRRWGTRLMLQILNNRRINDDFCPEYDGKLKPPRGIAFSSELLYLENGSWLSFSTTGSRQRGERPMEFHLDDPEHDPDGESTSMQRLREETERLIFKIIMPMVLRANRKLLWEGTLISRRHFLCKAFGDRNGQNFDNRFSYWDRHLWRALYRLPTGEQVSIWPEMWSEKNLAIIREKLGPAQFRSEMMNDPGVSDDSFFFLEDPRHSYTIEDPDEFLTSEPWRSNSTIVFHRKGDRVSTPLRDFLAASSVFITVDSAPTSSETSDYNAVVCMACTPFNELFVLDIFNARVKEHVAALQAINMADRWRASCIAVELHSKSQGIYGNLSHLLGTRAEGIAAPTHIPSLRALRVGYASKEARISGLQFRFGDPDVKDPTTYGYGGLIKFPLYQLGRSRPWDDLFQQIEEFNPDAVGGGLANDDALDAVSMSQDVLIGLRKKPIGPRPTDSPIDLLKEGKTEGPDGSLLAGMVDWSALPREDVLAIMEAQRTSLAKRNAPGRSKL